MIINKVKLLGWAVVVLLVLNATTIATVMYHACCNDNREALVIEPDSQPLDGRCFRQQLGFGNEQMDGFRTANRLFRKEANRIVADIEAQKAVMFAELAAKQPSREKIAGASARIGELHKELKDATATFYLSIKAICDPDQQQKLQQIFQPLFKNNASHGCRSDGGCQSHGNR